MADQVILHAAELLTGAGIRAKDGRRPREDDLGAIPDGAMAYSEKLRKILWVGKSKDLPKKFLRAQRQDLRGKSCVVPGFTDCHTHLVFEGNRAKDFADRCGGVSYEEIARRGGGILHTVTETRRATEAQLLASARKRVREAQNFGVSTLEIKSGYGLNFETELKCLRVIGKLRREFPEMRFHATFLGAHAFPAESTQAEYLAELEKMLAEVAAKKLAESCDVFVDKGYFTVPQARKLLLSARKRGLATRIHADELGNTESAVLAAKLGALSADHLLKVSPRGIRALARSSTVAVLLPGTAFYLKEPYAPARALIDGGARIALATDFNPGTCVTLNLPLIMTLSALYMKMTRAEIFAAVTYNAAKALGLENSQGTLERGLRADPLILPYSKFEEVYYQFGASSVHQ